MTPTSWLSVFGFWVGLRSSNNFNQDSPHFSSWITACSCSAVGLAISIATAPTSCPFSRMGLAIYKGVEEFAVGMSVCCRDINSRWLVAVSRMARKSLPSAEEEAGQKATGRNGPRSGAPRATTPRETPLIILHCNSSHAFAQSAIFPCSLTSRCDSAASQITEPDHWQSLMLQYIGRFVFI